MGEEAKSDELTYDAKKVSKLLNALPKTKPAKAAATGPAGKKDFRSFLKTQKN